MLDCQRVWPWFYHIVTCYLVAPHWYYIQAWHHDTLFTTVAVAHQDGVKDYSNLTKEQKLDFLSRTACGRRKFLVVCWSKSLRVPSIQEPVGRWWWPIVHQTGPLFVSFCIHLVFISSRNYWCSFPLSLCPILMGWFPRTGILYGENLGKW